MRTLFLSFILITGLVTLLPGQPRDTIRAGVINGMVRTGMWPEVVRMFEAQHPSLHVELIVTGQRPVIAESMRAGRLDFLVMHSGDITTNLVFDGYTTGMRPWVQNQLVIAGPADDPAGIAGFTSGVAAVTRIAEMQSPFIDIEGIGSREVGHALWTQAGIYPRGDWFRQEDAGEERENFNLTGYAAREGAYFIFGRIPILTAKQRRNDTVRIFVEHDPAMRRPYLTMLADPRRFPGANYEGAKQLQDFLFSDEVTRFLMQFDGGLGDGVPLFYPQGQGRP